MCRIYRLVVKHYVQHAIRLDLVEKEQISVYQLQSWAARLYLFQRWALRNQWIIPLITRYWLTTIRFRQLQLGNDEWGDKYRENLEKYNVSTNYVETANGKSTGLAQINVAENGENQIVIIPGANDLLTPADVEKAQDVLEQSKVLVCQLETPLQASLTALRKFKNGISILNASPAPNENTLDLFTLPTILCINQVEAAAMTKRSVPNIE